MERYPDWLDTDSEDEQPYWRDSDFDEGFLSYIAVNALLIYETHLLSDLR